EELAAIIQDKLNEIEKELNITLSKETKKEIAKLILTELLQLGDVDEDSISIQKKEIIRLSTIIIDRLGDIEDDLNFNLSYEVKREIIILLLKDLLNIDIMPKEEEKPNKEEKLKELATIIIDKINELEKDLELEMTNETKKEIAKLVLKELLEDGDFSNKNIDRIVKIIYEKYNGTFFDLGATPDREKIHTVVKGDTLANLSFKYYSKDDIKRGAHWIHIYDYSVNKNFIDPEKQPIKPYEVDEAFVRLNIGQKVAIPFFDNDKYPSTDNLLNKYGFELSDDGEVQPQINTGLPINIEVETEENDN
ncbi:MAG: LysM peptidoglycan-binding domain-containing protein, partial [Spirochaetota bacterium]